MTEHYPLLLFAGNRIQDKELLPNVSPELLKNIQQLVILVQQAPAGLAEAAIKDVLRMLDGIPAADSLPVLYAIYVRHNEVVSKHLSANGTNRLSYFTKLKTLESLFSKQRTARIAETARYIESGWY